MKILLASPPELLKARDYLAAADPALAPIITRAGICDLAPHTDYYGALVNSIIGQQLSVKAAATIKQRFRDLFGGTLPTPSEIIARSHAELRTAGLSNAKANYIRDLAEHVLDGRIGFDRLAEQANAEIIAELTDVKGIGEWTAQMFLMFCVGRLDVLATGDLGIRTAIAKLYGLASAPTPQQVIDISQANHWHPYESVACWYLWRSLDNAPQ